MIILPGEEGLTADFKKHRQRFYALIGHCVIQYQSVEDYLVDVFCAALGGDHGKAAAIFALARGLEAKLNMISAALKGADQLTVVRWDALLKRVATAQVNRNQIAHARAVHNGGLVGVQVGRENLPGKATRLRPPRMELRKRSGANEALWTEELMIQEARRSSELYRHLLAFSMTLKGEPVPPHLLDADAS
jgi:hypothetical protein